jgi:hypothetical protein
MRGFVGLVYVAGRLMTDSANKECEVQYNLTAEPSSLTRAVTRRAGQGLVVGECQCK